MLSSLLMLRDVTLYCFIFYLILSYFRMPEDWMTKNDIEYVHEMSLKNTINCKLVAVPSSPRRTRVSCGCDCIRPRLWLWMIDGGDSRHRRGVLKSPNMRSILGY